MFHKKLCILFQLFRPVFLILAELNKLLRVIKHTHLIQRNSNALRRSYDFFYVVGAVGKPANHR